MPSETLVTKPDAPGAPRVHVERVRTRDVEPTLSLTPPTPESPTPAGNAAAAAVMAEIDAAIERAHAEEKPAAAPPEAEKPRAPDGKFLPKVDAEVKAKADAKPEPKPEPKPELAKVEPPKPEAPKPNDAEERVRAGMAAVAREERRVTQDKQAFKAERAHLTATVEAANAKLAEVTALLASAKSDPIAFLQRTGLVVEDVIRAAVADPSKVQTSATREQSELEAIRKIAEEAKATAGESAGLIAKAKAEAQREALTFQLSAALQQNAETYEATIAEFGDNAANVILGYIDDMKAQGEDVDLRTAVDRIEEHCVGVWKQRHERASALKKLRGAAPAAAKVEDPAAALAPKEEPKPPKGNGSPTTITRETASAAPSPERHRRGGLQRDFDDIEALTQSYRRAKGK